jgi:hypothetical protein
MPLPHSNSTVNARNPRRPENASSCSVWKDSFLRAKLQHALTSCGRFALSCVPCSDGGLLRVWDTEAGCWDLSSFDPSIPSWRMLGEERLLSFSDQQLLQRVSTTPQHEPPWFTTDMRAKIRWLLDMQEPEMRGRGAVVPPARYAWDPRMKAWVREKGDGSRCGGELESAAAARPSAAP